MADAFKSGRGGAREGAGRPATVGAWSHIKVSKATKDRIRTEATRLGLTFDHLLAHAVGLIERQEDLRGTDK